MRLRVTLQVIGKANPMQYMCSRLVRRHETEMVPSVAFLVRISSVGRFINLIFGKPRRSLFPTEAVESLEEQRNRRKTKRRAFFPRSLTPRHSSGGASQGYQTCRFPFTLFTLLRSTYNCKSLRYLHYTRRIALLLPL